MRIGPSPLSSEPVAPASRLGRVAVAVAVVVAMAVGCTRGREEPAAAPSDPALVQTATGVVRGLVGQDHRFFAGIPYAAPPVGPLRWKPAEPALKWDGVREAGRLGPRCIQDLGGDLELGRQTDEDCLTLNVWTPMATPDSAPAAPRPVMVWIHGGSFVNGSGGIYDAQRLAVRGDIIVVTINYRLGVLGFLAHPALGSAGDVGNYGLGDQQAALRWVRDNIAQFGGDPAKVTVAGESAGGMSVCDHLVAPGSQGLFDAAIIQSAPCQAQATLPVAQARSVDYAAEVGCADPESAAACLRALPVGKLRKPLWFYNIGEDKLIGPVTGTTTLPVDPVKGFAEGRAARVPVMIGTTRDEFTLFVALEYLHGGKSYSASDYPDLLAATFGDDSAAVAEQYPLTDFDSVPLAYSAAVTDGVFACVGDRMADALARDDDDAVYSYEFNDRGAPTPDPLRTLPFAVGASHSLELRYLFDVGGAPPFDAAQQKLSDQMIDYWSQFVTNGTPRAAGQPDWPDVGAADPVMSLQPDGSRMIADFEQAHHCEFWAALQ
ncbi:carboxylic ester hydrolase [Mycolicibacterium cyprinidarum]|uniref:Carboxylic ester hydrolase n=1 Tax=Mycolicibacterium cyprinidarum TaxID=2860311 RepID=A0ABQ4V2D9_9MYCO|nr:carboxylic ester hydrolase [Mycolicibacterium sp. NGTWSNA01]GJF12432.1 carboxylic ester hydrolase [Mycolicibacterium sp. NGTWS0302]